VLALPKVHAYTEHMDLAAQTCVACEGDAEPLSRDEAEKLLAQLTGWKLEKDTIRKEYTFKDFKGSMAFVNKVAELAEAEGHHPDIMIWYRVVTLALTTHAISGLSMNDFVLAAKIDALR
jgi:4a-hydroxytetrahydrobiopterin dehydratase